MGKDLTKPRAEVVPPFYLCLEASRKQFGLEEAEPKEIVKEVIIRKLRGKETRV